MKRFLPLLFVLALGVAACGDPTADSEEAVLSYSLAAGDEFTYEVELDQHIEMTSSGGAALMGEEVPGEASIDLSGSATFTHAVSEGPETGTFEIHITGEFADVSITGTIDGEEVDSSEIPDFANLEPVDATVVVDEQGNLIPGEGAGTHPLGELFGDLGPLAGGAPVQGLDPGRFVGPPLPEGEAAVGDSWTDEIEKPGPGDEPIVTTITSTVSSSEELDGVEMFVIDSTATTSPIEFDLTEFFAGMFGGLAGDEMAPEQSAEIDALLEQLRFQVAVDDATAESRTWFDPAAGLARRSETSSGTNISMDLNLPDQTTGAFSGTVMDLTLDQEITYQLISGG